jgi:hypothetical protein
LALTLDQSSRERYHAKGMLMKFLITGGAGFIGSAVACFLETKHDVLAYRQNL